MRKEMVSQLNVLREIDVISKMKINPEKVSDDVLEELISLPPDDEGLVTIPNELFHKAMVDQYGVEEAEWIRKIGSI